MKLDWSKIFFNHKFYVVPGKEEYVKIVRGLLPKNYVPKTFDYVKVETRVTKKGVKVETYVIPIARKETRDNIPQPGLLFIKILYDRKGEPKEIYYNIVKFTWASIIKLRFLLEKLEKIATTPELWNMFKEETVKSVAEKLKKKGKSAKITSFFR